MPPGGISIRGPILTVPRQSALMRIQGPNCLSIRSRQAKDGSFWPAAAKGSDEGSRLGPGKGACRPDCHARAHMPHEFRECDFPNALLAARVGPEPDPRLPDPRFVLFVYWAGQGTREKASRRVRPGSEKKDGGADWFWSKRARR